MYVDDIISEMQDVNEVEALQNQITELMSKGGFKVHKWHSNATTSFHSTGNQEETSSVNLKLNDTIRTLGLIWEPFSNFVFTIEFYKEIRSNRELLSEISKVFDSLGLLGLVITLAKLLMQAT